MDPALSTARIIHLAFSASMAVFTVLPFIVTQDEPSSNLLIPMVMPVIGFAQILFSVFGVPLVMSKLEFQPAHLIRLAFLEAGLLCSFVGAFLGGSLWVHVGVFLVCLAAMFVIRPTDEAFTAWEIRRLQGDS